MSSDSIHVRARVQHEPDRSYTVFVDSPDGEVEVGRTRLTVELLTVAKHGAARVLGVPESAIDPDIDVVVPLPPYARERQWVRIIKGDPGEPEDEGLLGEANWWPREGAWFVTTAATGTGIYPTEHLDFAPTTAEAEAAELEAQLGRIRSRDD